MPLSEYFMGSSFFFFLVNLMHRTPPLLCIATTCTCEYTIAMQRTCRHDKQQKKNNPEMILKLNFQVEQFYEAVSH